MQRELSLESVNSRLNTEEQVTINKHSYTIVIPSYNEANRIRDTILDRLQNLPEISEIIVVVYGRDNADEVALSWGEKGKVTKYNERLGQDGAVFNGIRAALSDIVCFIYADGFTRWFEVKRILSIVSVELSVVIGSRWVENSRIKKKEPIRNIIGGRVFHYLSFAILGIREKYVFCGLKAFKKELAIELSSKITITDQMFNHALIYNLKLIGIEPLEIGIEWSYKEGTKLSVDFRTVIFMFLTLIGLKIPNSLWHKPFAKFSTNIRGSFESL